jgi:hypothetical protein
MVGCVRGEKKGKGRRKIGKDWKGKSGRVK